MKEIVPLNAVLIPEQAERVFKGIFYDVYHWQQQMFDNSFEIFEMLRSTDILKILVVVDGKLVVLHEEQPAIGTFTDIPGGRNDHGIESNLEAAKREVLEETGMTFKSWKLISVRQPALKIENFIYLYVATDLLSSVEPVLDNGEKITLELVSFEVYMALGKAGKLRSWPTVSEKIQSVEELLMTPEFKGKEIER
jgi:ADP-ribose pyrophosphatase